MKIQNNIYQNPNSQFLNAIQWKEIITKFIKEAILDIIKFRINKNAYEEEDSSNKNLEKNEKEKENEYEHIDINSYDLEKKFLLENKNKKNSQGKKI